MSELFERTIGSAGAVTSFGLLCIWVVDFPLAHKLLASGCVAFAVCTIAAALLLKRRQLHKTRKEQLRLHREEKASCRTFS